VTQEAAPAAKHSKHQTEFNRLKALALTLGRKLQLERRASDGRITYVITDQAQRFYFSHLHDVHGHLNALEGSSHG
jgi:hypothetical protein